MRRDPPGVNLYRAAVTGLHDGTGQGRRERAAVCLLGHRMSIHWDGGVSIGKGDGTNILKLWGRVYGNPIFKKVRVGVTPLQIFKSEKRFFYFGSLAGR